MPRRRPSRPCSSARRGAALGVARVAAAFVALAATGALATEPEGPPPRTDATHYHGFAIDGSRLGGLDASRLDVLHPALARQVALVEAAGVPADVLAFFRTVPIHVERDLPRPPGQFVGDRDGGFVRVLPDGMPPDRPILLHELLHAFHADVIGLDDRTIRDAFEAAKRSPDVPPGDASAHYLENAREYFAVTSTIFLVGSIRQPPYDCTVLRSTQPAYLAYLATRLGPHACR